MNELSKNAKSEVLIHTVGDNPAGERRVILQLEEGAGDFKPKTFCNKLMDEDSSGLNFSATSGYFGAYCRIYLFSAHRG